ncbi:hypothetical protein BD324DRAFT_162114 [Kockovaella imperatae]|uniref:Protein YOP1 n=1 Tax=Kockovaella imperatae TaxID=4999 RepID=A0A1Y1U994_9TREE|nr:hypothetical protein BD324DRAFT_162114 [Kockovaella imperatae]ORX34600.1 hypothetical protein BD324DRAFT_162114 [Kockovaella imperatae]
MPSDKPSGALSSSPSSRSKTRLSGSDYDKHSGFIDSCLKSHAEYLAQPTLIIAQSLGVSPLHLSYGVGAVILALHLVLPAFLLPHFSALFTLIPPVQSSLQSITLETKKSGRDARDAAQWCIYWVIYTFFELARGSVSVYLPGVVPFFELSRSVCLIICGGPWFGRAGLVSAFFLADFASPTDNLQRPDAARKEDDKTPEKHRSKRSKQNGGESRAGSKKDEKERRDTTSKDKAG